MRVVSVVVVVAAVSAPRPPRASELRSHPRGRLRTERAGVVWHQVGVCHHHAHVSERDVKFVGDCLRE